MKYGMTMYRISLVSLTVVVLLKVDQSNWSTTDPSDLSQLYTTLSSLILYMAVKIHHKPTSLLEGTLNTPDEVSGDNQV